MKSYLPNPFIFRNLLFFFVCLFASEFGMAQAIYIGSNAELYVAAGIPFTTSNTVVDVDDTGIFSVEAGSSWGSAQEYVDGKVSAYGTGKTILPTGDNGVYAPVTIDHTGDATATYINSQPMNGSNGADVDAVGSIEYWELTGTGIVTLPWNDNSDITSLVNDNGGVLNSVSIVGYNGGVWDLISATHTSVVTGDLLNGNVTSDINNVVALDGFSQFTFGIDHQTVLGLNDLFLSTGISMISNPVRTEEANIRFRASGELIDLKASIYDINGRVLRVYDDIDLYLGEGNLPKSNLKSGLYFIKFEHQGKQGTKKIIIE